MAFSRQIQVGLFVFFGLAAASAIVFLIGDNKMVFDPKVDYMAYFHDVQGLQRGATVRMGGVDVGTVTRVRYLADPTEQRIEVVLSVVSREAGRVRRDSEVAVAPKGLLGDKMLTLGIGSSGAPLAQDGQVLPSREGADMTAMLDRIQEMSGRAEGIMSNLERATAPLAEPDLQQDLRESVHALNRVLTSLANGPGYASRLLSNQDEAVQLSGLVAELRDSTEEVRVLVAELSRVAQQVQRGPGLAHALIYGGEGEQLVSRAGHAAEELALLLQGVRTGNGMARGLLFGSGGASGAALSGEGEVAVTELAGAAKDLHAILSDIRAGKGTLGALLVDPSVYEDLKTVLGNVERNRILKALVRYAITRDEARGVEVADPVPPPTQAPQSAAKP